jgi:hypothetical protein
MRLHQLKETTNMAISFVTTIPSTEEEMLAICSEIVARDKSVQNFKNQIECLEQLVGVMEEYLDHETNLTIGP